MSLGCGHHFDPVAVREVNGCAVGKDIIQYHQCYMHGPFRDCMYNWRKMTQFLGKILVKRFQFLRTVVQCFILINNATMHILNI